MIRIYKSTEPPLSLESQASWSEEDVCCQLKKDQYGKCYLCERQMVTDFQVEHLRSRGHNPDLTYDWSNLLWSCSYCNQKKSDVFDNLFNPINHDIENLIYQKIDFPRSVAIFRSQSENTPESEATVSLLDRVFNGTRNMRTLREQQFYDYVKSRLTSFQQMVISWLRDKSQESRQAIIGELDIKAEFLGIKYWIIQSNPELLSEFRKFMFWNRTESSH